MEGETVATPSRRETLLAAYIEDGLVATKPSAGYLWRYDTGGTAARPRLGQSDLSEAGYPLAGGQVRRLNRIESPQG